MDGITLPITLSFLYPAFLWLLLLLPLLAALGWPERRQPDRRRRWLGLGLRLLILAGLVLALAGLQLEWPVDSLTTVFLLDASDSVTIAERARAENFLREALRQKPPADQAAVIMFGGDALVEQLPRLEPDMPSLASTPLKTATDIEQALRLALALLPNEGAHRLVLLSDGQETSGEARRLLNLAAARRVEISTYPLGQVDPLTGPPEVLVEQLSAPGQARQGQAVPVEVVVTASRPTEAILRWLVDGALTETRPVRLIQGRNRFSFSLPLAQAGFHRFRVEVEAAEDGRWQNNWGAAFTTVYGPPEVLVVEGQPGEAASLSAALQAAGMNVTVIAPAALPGNLPALTRYEAVVLANVPSAALPAATQESLVNFERDLGRGLVMLGGPESFGAGGYLRSPLEKALPVEMEVRSRSQEPNLALVLAVDKSGSMGGCHCDNPDLNQTYTRVPSGLPKIDIAKEAILQTTAVLGQLDYLGVVSFDNSAHWELKTGPWEGVNAVEQAIGGITANGQTNIYAGLAAAETALVAAPARLKHIILLTDGWSHSGAYDDLTTRLAEEGITLSVVAAGGGSAVYLADLARKGGGQYYPAATMSDVPQIFLKETVRAAGNYIIEEPFKPVPLADNHPILRGLDPANLPPLWGYNGVTPKAAAQVALLTPRGDPLLAAWQYGLGRSVAWTSDLSGRWGQEWLAWEGLARFAAQMVNWSLPLPGDEKLEVSVLTRGGQASLTATTGDKEAGRVVARLVPPAGPPLEAELLPNGPRRYQAEVSLPAEGVYLAQVTAYGADNLPLASRTLGVVAPYSAEYASLSLDPALLNDLTGATGGQTLTDPAQAFEHNLAVGWQTQPLWPLLLLLAALLFPLDVAVRRLRVSRSDWRGLEAKLWRPTPVAAPVSPTVQAFQQVRQRARPQPPAAAPESAPSASLPAPPTAPEPPQPAAPESPPAAESGDTLSRLRAAKQRTRREPD